MSETEEDATDAVNENVEEEVVDQEEEDEEEEEEEDYGKIIYYIILHIHNLLYKQLFILIYIFME